VHLLDYKVVSCCKVRWWWGTKSWLRNPCSDSRARLIYKELFPFQISALSTTSLAASGMANRHNYVAGRPIFRGRGLSKLIWPRHVQVGAWSGVTRIHLLEEVGIES